MAEFKAKRTAQEEAEDAAFELVFWSGNLHAALELLIRAARDDWGAEMEMCALEGITFPETRFEAEMELLARLEAALQPQQGQPQPQAKVS